MPCLASWLDDLHKSGNQRLWPRPASQLRLGSQVVGIRDVTCRNLRSWMPWEGGKCSAGHLRFSEKSENGGIFYFLWTLDPRFVNNMFLKDPTQRQIRMSWHILLLQEILHRRGHMRQYTVMGTPAPPFQCCLLTLCASAGFQSFNSFALVTNIPYQC